MCFAKAACTFEGEGNTTFACFREPTPLRVSLGCFHVQKSLLSWSMGAPEFWVHSMSQVLPPIHIYTYLKHQREPHLYVHAHICIIYTGKLKVNLKQVQIIKSAPYREVTLTDIFKRLMNILTPAGWILGHHCIMFCMSRNWDWHSNC